MQHPELNITSHDTQQNNSTSSLILKFKHIKPQNKKYILKKMITPSEKSFLSKLIKKPQLSIEEELKFIQTIKQQKKNIIISTFIRKLKLSTVLQTVPSFITKFYESFLQDNPINYVLQAIQLKKNIKILISFVLSIQILILLLISSIQLMIIEQKQNISNRQYQNVESFQRINTIIKCYKIFSLIIHLLEMIKKLIVKNSSQNFTRKVEVKYIYETIRRYVKSTDFIFDCLVGISLIIDLTFSNNSYSQYFHTSFFKTLFNLLLFFKIKSLAFHVKFLELTLLQNEYRVQLWSLCKVFIVNFIIAHSLALILIGMTSIQKQNNWLIVKGLKNIPWEQKYIWGYYWATTIILTVGFGDIVPINKYQVLCIILIETIGCILLAYNINRVGYIISQLNSYEESKNTNIKVFNHLAQKTNFSSDLISKVTNYIKQQTVIKQNYNLKEENQFFSNLPLSFKQELLKQMNKNIWIGMSFFQSLSYSLLQQVSKYLQKKLTHPQQIIYSRNQQVNIMIFNNGSYGFVYNKGKISKLNNKLIQSCNVSSNNYKLVSLDFLFDSTLNYDIKCIDYAILYKLQKQKFIEILANHSYDYEYYFMMKDKDKFLLNQFEVVKCQICSANNDKGLEEKQEKNQKQACVNNQNQILEFYLLEKFKKMLKNKNYNKNLQEKHTLFKCPCLHYIPLKQHIIQKYLHNLKIKQNKQSKYKKQKIRIHSKHLIQNFQHKSLKDRQYIFAQLMKKRLVMTIMNKQNQQSSYKNIYQTSNISSLKQAYTMQEKQETQRNSTVMNKYFQDTIQNGQNQSVNTLNSKNNNDNLKTFGQKTIQYNMKNSLKNNSNRITNQQKKYIDKIIDRITQNIEKKLFAIQNNKSALEQKNKATSCLNQYHSQVFNMWQLQQCDRIYNYNYYFTKYNASQFKSFKFSQGNNSKSKTLKKKLIKLGLNNSGKYFNNKQLFKKNQKFIRKSIISINNLQANQNIMNNIMNNKTNNNIMKNKIYNKNKYKQQINKKTQQQQDKIKQQSYQINFKQTYTHEQQNQQQEYEQCDMTSIDLHIKRLNCKINQDLMKKK